jgi:hypothetical protein
VRLKTSHSRARDIATYKALISSRCAACASTAHMAASEGGTCASLRRKATLAGAASSTGQSTSTTAR